MILLLHSINIGLIICYWQTILHIDILRHIITRPNVLDWFQSFWPIQKLYPAKKIFILFTHLI